MHTDLIHEIENGATPLTCPKDLADLVDHMSRAKIVMIGEASHGTHEFYEWRRLLSEWLIVKHDFRFIAVEGDWPPCERLDRYVKGAEGQTAESALEAFRRWPTWMWANTEMIRVGEWLHEHNERLPEGSKIGFHGLDVYSLQESIAEVLGIMEKLNPFAARRVRQRYACFDPYMHDEKAYVASLFQNPEGCEREAVAALEELLRVRLDGLRDREDALFDAQQNARIIRNAEAYYRTMIHADEASWNVRDRHMMETLELLLERYGKDSRAIVWAHNTHIGDARATDMASGGLVNLGQLAREKFGENQVALVGFGTYSGEVTASHAWDGPIEKLPVPAAKPGSTEDFMHDATQALGGAFYLLFDELSRQGPLAEVFSHRAIGVVYDPQHERANYVPTSLANRYDAFLFIDRTRALEPLIFGFEEAEIPETWPRGA